MSSSSAGQRSGVLPESALDACSLDPNPVLFPLFHTVTHQQLQSLGNFCVCGACNFHDMLNFPSSLYFSFVSVLLPKCPLLAHHLGFHIPARAPNLNPGTWCLPPDRRCVTCVCHLSARTSIPCQSDGAGSL